VDLEAYVAERRAALFRFAMVLTGDPVLADDLLADVLSDAFVHWRKVSAADDPHAYVRRMLVNAFATSRRRRARTAPRGDLSDLVEPVADHAAAHAEHQRLVAELRQLPPRQRAAVVLRFYESLSFAEIAEILGTGENAVRSNVSRGLRRLHLQLTDDEHADAGHDPPLDTPFDDSAPVTVGTKP
jgi:RNA polymerase sigma-70 factor (sigma-E family)